MSVNTVQQYIKDAIDTIPLPEYEGALEAFIMPPNPGELVKPVAFIWSSRWTERRRTLSRGYGFKKVKFSPRIYVMSVEDPSAANADVAFPSVIEAILAKLRGVTVPTPLLDITTGVTSYLLSIGEDFDVDYDSVRSLQDQRYVRNLAMITAYVEESIIG